MPAAHKPLYSSKIIKAGALLADTRILLSHSDLTVSVQKNIERLRQDNVFGKASRSRVEDVLAIFRQRALAEAAITKALVVLGAHGFPAVSLDRILYFHTAKADRLLYDKEIAQQEEFISELQDFESKLRRVANLHLDPDLNDGVVLNSAPLRELVPWKEAQKYWDELLDGKYECSSIGRQLRQLSLVRSP
jgi:hypothetical protein